MPTHYPVENHPSDEKHKKKKTLVGIAVVTQLVLALLSLAGGIFAIVIYTLPDYNRDLELQCPLQSLQTFTLVFGICELCCFVLSTISPLCLLLEIKMREGYHPGLVSQCLVVLRILIGFVSASFLIKNVYSFYSALCPVELKPFAPYNSMLIFNLSTMGVFIITGIALFFVFLFVGFSGSSEKGAATGNKHQVLEEEDEDDVATSHSTTENTLQPRNSQDQSEKNFHIIRN